MTSPNWTEKGFLLTQVEPLESDRVRLHYLLADNERRAVTIPSKVHTPLNAENIGAALANNDRRIRGRPI